MTLLDELQPMPDKELGFCSPECPYLELWEHPYYHHTAWCWKQAKDLNWHDYWQADCLHEKPSKMANYIASGRTTPKIAQAIIDNHKEREDG